MTALGEGGMATVFLARDLALDRQVAIKVMNPALMSSPAALGRFRREARIAAALDHPHIISIYAVGEDAELAFYVMRYVEGRSLHELVREEGAQTFRRVEGIITDIGQALHYAHRRGVIHRDVKPANIMLDTDDWLFVTDFGIAKHDEVDRLTVSGHVFGTPHYMSPEYFNGGLIGSASDQYALGVVAYELLTGTAPFPGETIGEVMRGHLFDPIPLLRTVRPDLPEAVEACVNRMLNKDAALRYPTVADAVASFKAAGKSGESGVITELIDTPARSPLYTTTQNPAAMRARPMTWPMRISFGIGGVAAVGLAFILVSGLLPPSGLNARSNPDAPGPNIADSTPVVGVTPDTLAAGTQARDAGARETSAPRGPSNPAPRDAAGSAKSSSDSRIVSTPAAGVDPPRGAPGAIRIGSRLPATVLYINGLVRQQIGEEGPQVIPAPSGRVRLSIAKAGCQPWDTVFTLRAGDTTTVGYRNPSCP